MNIFQLNAYRLFVLRAAVGALTLAMLAVALWAPKRHIQIHPASHTVLNVFDDREQELGRSEGIWLDRDLFAFRCTLKEGVPYRVCGVSMKFYKEPRNVRIADGNPESYSWIAARDLSRYEGLIYELDYIGEAEKLRFFTRNSVAREGDVEEILTHQLNFAYIYRDELQRKKQLYLAFDELTVADWWLEQFQMRRRHAKPSFDRVLEVTVDLPPEAPLGSHEVMLKKVYLVGDWVADEWLYWSIAGLWLLVLVLEAWHRYYTLVYKTRVYRASVAVLEATNKSLQDHANQDELTGVYNRRGMEEVCQLIWQSGEGMLRCVMVLDIDNFKSVNDTYGHAAGDKVLKEFAELLKRYLLGADRLGRWGGEEFVVVSPQDSRHSARAFADTMRVAVDSTEFKTVDGVLMPVTVSIGVAFVEPKESFANAFERADTALYEAKHSGRNRVCLASISPP